MSEFSHTPVMLKEAVAALNPADNAVYVDATLGGGGYARALLGAANCMVIGLDRDPVAVRAARRWARAYGGRFRVVEAPFAAMEDVLDSLGVSEINGAVFDLGVSSMQIDTADRGFSFQKDGPLDMRMGADGPDAAMVVNSADEADLADIIFVFGEERKSRAVAKAIVAARQEVPITTTAQLASIVEKAMGGRRGSDIHPATRTFQALRIFVNEELDQVVEGLAAAERRLVPAGRLAAVSFHSLEDRLVKRFFAGRSGKVAAGSRHAPPTEEGGPEPSFRLLKAKAVPPSDEEIAANPRARSAKLRAGVRLDAPAHEVDPAALGLPQVSSSLSNFAKGAS